MKPSSEKEHYSNYNHLAMSIHLLKSTPLASPRNDHATSLPSKHVEQLSCFRTAFLFSNSFPVFEHHSNIKGTRILSRDLNVTAKCIPDAISNLPVPNGAGSRMLIRIVRKRVPFMLKRKLDQIITWVDTNDTYISTSVVSRRKITVITAAFNLNSFHPP
jgi:hypothetical protein